MTIIQICLLISVCPKGLENRVSKLLPNHTPVGDVFSISFLCFFLLLRPFPNVLYSLMSNLKRYNRYFNVKNISVIVASCVNEHALVFTNLCFEFIFSTVYTNSSYDLWYPVDTFTSFFWDRFYIVKRK